AELVRVDGERLREVPVAEDLHEIEATLDEALRLECLEVHGRAGVEHLEGADVDVRDAGRERVTKAALGQAPLHRRLTAVEVQLVDVALRASLLALLPAGRGLAHAGADTTTDATSLFDGALGGLEPGENVRHG